MAVLTDFIHAADQLVKYAAIFREVPEKQHTSATLTARKMELKDLWVEVKAKYAVCARQGAENAETFDSEVFESKYKLSNETYISCLGLIIEYETKLKGVVELSPATSLISKPDISKEESSSHCIKLPPCDTEIFHGDYLSWPSFRDMFDAIYIKHPKLGAVEKLFHLRSKTRGEAFSLVSKFPLTNTSFDLAWESLRSTYENKRILLNNQIKRLLNLPICPEESSKGIIKLQRHINDCISALKAHGVCVDSWDPILVFACSNRLPPTTLALWEQSLSNPTDVPTWKQLDQFLSSRFQVLETISDVTSSSTSTFDKRQRTNKPSIPVKTRANIYHAKGQEFACRLCNGKHSIRKCSQFIAMDVSSRIEFVRQNNICENCLAVNHKIRTCKSQFTCNICKKRHHSLLHLNTNLSSSSLTHDIPSSLPSTSAAALASENCATSHLQSTSPEFVPQTSGRTFFASTQKGVLLATALVNIVGNDSNHLVRALIDPGSEVSFISESVQMRLNLPTSPINMSISSISTTHAATSKKLCAFSIINEEDQAKPILAQAIVLRKLTNNLPSVSFSLIDHSQLNGLRLADPTFDKSSQVDLLIGADLYPSILKDGLQRVSDSLVAQSTIFGWVLSGPIPTLANTFSTFVADSQSSCLDEQIRKFWELEEITDRKPILSAEDTFCEDFYERTTYRRPDGRYVVRLPFKSKVPLPKLGLSRNIALRQFLRNEKHLSKNPVLRTQYSKVVSEYLTLNHMREVKSNEITRNGTISSYYLPHHAVLKPESVSTKLRVVFNASSASSTGISLNDLLYPGPVLQRDLTSLVIRWRFFQFVFNADIEKMYRQIVVHSDDTSYQRILFRHSLNSSVEDYELTTVTFGVNCAPYLAIRTLLRLAEDSQVRYPLASKIISSETYVDDVLSGAHDLPTAQRAQMELIEMLESAGFPLRKWTSNSPSLLDHLPQNHILSEHFLKFERDSTTKTLGIRWNARGDYFYFTAPEIQLSVAPTKREVFSQIAQLFDPAGWLAPIIIVAKILMQRIWMDKTNWDETLLFSSLIKWQSFVNALPDINRLKIPRWVEYSPTSRLQFHGFCDSSEQAYAAALYVRIEKADGTISTHLLCAKCKVAPIKPVSVPRLELCGAVLLSKLVKAYLSNLPIQDYELFLWTDSIIVIAWLNKHPSTWKTFVANRTSEIIDNVGNVAWRHVKSEDNPADIASRGTFPNMLRENTLWWNGPSWLREPQAHWPVGLPIHPVADAELEVKVASFVIQHSPEDILERFSSLPRALRVLTYIFRFFYRISKSRSDIFTQVSNSAIITQREINFVKTRMILLSQKHHFAKEYAVLSEGRTISSNSSILSLTPSLDSNQLLRVNGRLSNANLPFSERYPIILPYASHFTRLLVQFVHEISLHSGNALMLRVIRQAFWVPKLQNLIKACIRQCKTCVIHKKQLRTQLMAALPSERCTYSPPFTYTGIDFAGPFTFKSFLGRGCRTTKGYACVFVCFSTKAIHLEAASDLSSEVFLAAFARFVARRGLPTEVFSDHGTNFIGADVILQREFKKFLASISNETSRKYSVQGLSWSFIPPGAPHMGGLWEAGVKSFKTHFRKIADSHKFTFEEFSTLLARIEGCLNSRPISPMSNDPSNLLALTPGHFLRGSPLLTFPEPNREESPLSLINRWEKLKCLQQQFCRRWKDEYLKELHKRHKWQFPEENLKINDLVVIKHENLPSTEWRLGRVVKLSPGTDGRVRVATIKTQNGEVTRPVVKLCVLPAA